MYRTSYSNYAVEPELSFTSIANLPKTIMEKHVSFRTKKPVSVSGVIGSAAGQGALSKRSVTTPGKQGFVYCL